MASKIAQQSFGNAGQVIPVSHGHGRLPMRVNRHDHIGMFARPAQQNCVELMACSTSRW